MYTLSGFVEHGDARARELGFPTANVALEGLDDLDGVWVGYATAQNGETYLASVSIGRRQTFYGEVGRLLLEAHLLNFSGSLYGQLLTVELVHFVRPQLTFDSAETLTAQIDQDIRATIAWKAELGNYLPPSTPVAGIA